MLASKYTVELVGKVGPGCQNSGLVILIRVVKFVALPGDDRRVELEADQRHAHLLVKALGLQSAKTAETPRVKHTEEVYLDALASPALPAADSTLYRSCVMRANYLGQDRMDIQEAI